MADLKLNLDLSVPGDVIVPSEVIKSPREHRICKSCFHKMLDDDICQLCGKDQNEQSSLDSNSEEESVEEVIYYKRESESSDSEESASSGCPYHCPTCEGLAIEWSIDSSDEENVPDSETDSSGSEYESL